MLVRRIFFGFRYEIQSFVSFVLFVNPLVSPAFIVYLTYSYSVYSTVLSTLTVACRMHLASILFGV